MILPLLKLAGILDKGGRWGRSPGWGKGYGDKGGRRRRKKGGRRRKGKTWVKGHWRKK